MANFNKVFLMGNLTRDPELRYTPGGTAVAEFGLAVNRQWRGQDGEKRDETCFVDITAWGRQAEVINQYMKKGRSLFVEGRLQYDQWEGQDGQKRSKLRVVLENFQFVGGRGGDDAPDGGGSGGGAPRRQRSAPPQSRRQSGQSGPPQNGPDDDTGFAPGDDDIPF